MPHRFILPAILAATLTSCIGLKPGVDTTKTYALGLPNPAQSSSATTTARGYLARPQFPVYMEGNALKFLSGNGEIVTLPEARWAEPMDVGVARAVSHFIESSNDDLKSDFYPWVRPDDATFILQLNFHQLIATNDGRILISANWECQYAGGKTETGFFTHNTLEWSGDAQSMIDGINKALELLAAEIVVALKKELLATKEY